MSANGVSKYAGSVPLEMDLFKRVEVFSACEWHILCVAVRFEHLEGETGRSYLSPSHTCTIQDVSDWGNYSIRWVFPRVLLLWIICGEFNTISLWFTPLASRKASLIADNQKLINCWVAEGPATSAFLQRAVRLAFHLRAGNSTMDHWVSYSKDQIICFCIYFGEGRSGLTNYGPIRTYCQASLISPSIKTNGVASLYADYFYTY